MGSKGTRLWISRGFLGWNETFGGVLALAKKALAMNEVSTEVPQYCFILLV